MHKTRSDRYSGSRSRCSRRVVSRVATQRLEPRLDLEVEDSRLAFDEALSRAAQRPRRDCPGRYAQAPDDSRARTRCGARLRASPPSQPPPRGSPPSAFACASHASEMGSPPLGPTAAVSSTIASSDRPAPSSATPSKRRAGMYAGVHVEDMAAAIDRRRELPGRIPHPRRACRHDETERVDIACAVGFGFGFAEARHGREKVRVEPMGGFAARRQRDRCPVFVFGDAPVPLERAPDFRERKVRVRNAGVELERAECRRFRLLQRRATWLFGMVRDRNTRARDRRMRGGKVGIERERVLVILDRGTHAIEPSAIPVKAAFQICLICLGPPRRRATQHIDLIGHELHRERSRDMRGDVGLQVQRLADRPVVRSAQRCVSVRVSMSCAVIRMRSPSPRTLPSSRKSAESSRPISLALFGDRLNSIEEVRAITPRRPGHKRPSCVIISSVSPSLKYSCVGSLLRFANGKTTSRTAGRVADLLRDLRPDHVQVAHGLPVSLDSCDEAIAAPVQRFDEPWIVRVIAQRCAQPLDRRIQTVLEIDERPGRPQTLPQFFARHDVARAFEHHRQNFERLILKPDADAALAQFARAQVDFESPKSLDAPRAFLQGQHRREKFSSPRVRSRHFTKM